ncbi:MAG: efflux RND transporter periplasmic adaptor subunit [Gammaproteobacteria bacterium]
MQREYKEYLHYRLKLIISNLTLVFVVFSILSLMACQSESDEETTVPPRPVKSMVVADPLKSSLRYFPGNILANIDAELSFEVAEKLIELPINEGDEVAKGQLLARLDPEKYEDRVDEAKARYSLSLAQFKRAQELRKNGHISQSDYDILESKYKIEEANLNTIERDLEDTYLYAPFDGIVARKYVENYERIREKQKILTLQYIAFIDIEIHVPEHIMINIRKDTEREVYAIFDARPQEKFSVKFKEFSSEADRATQTYSVIFTMPSPKMISVLPGMSVTIEAILPDFSDGGRQFYLIPSSAIFVDKDQKRFVWVIDPKTSTVQKRAVDVGSMTGDQIQIIKGIESGERIVSAGVHFLQEDESVSLRKQDK